MDVLLGIFGKVMEQIASVTLSVLLTEAQASRARFRLRRPERGELAGRATKSLTEMRTRELREGLHALPGDLPLRELAVTNRAGDRRLLGVERFQDLERVSVVGTPDDEDVAALARLPRLTGLTVTQPESLAALAALAALPALRTLHLIDPAPASDEELAALRSRLPGVGLILKS